MGDPKHLLKPVLLLAAAALLAGAVYAAPEPSLVPKSWEFKFKFDHPRPIAVKNLKGEFEWYWYITYEVVNNTGQERLFIPELAVATEKGHVVDAGKGIRSTVFAAIKERVGNRLLDSPSDVIGRLLQGDDNGKESVIIWKAFDENVDSISVFVGGLSGETAVIKVPDPEDTSKTVETILSKSLQIDYQFPGHPSKPDDQVVQFEGQKWIMR